MKIKQELFNCGVIMGEKEGVFNVYCGDFWWEEFY
jgi:hypothetical protein